MTQDPITTRFLEVFNCLKKNGKVRSARQFALSLETYPQSLNDIIKGRREATLQMIRKLVEVYDVNAHYLLTGQGSYEHSNGLAVNTSPEQNISFIQAHQFASYADALQKGVSENTNWTTWTIPSQLIGSAETHAFQCDTDHLSECVSRGDVLFARKVPQSAWKSNLSSKRIYVIVLMDTVFFVRINDLDLEGIYLKPDERSLPQFVAFEQIQEVWLPSTKLSRNILTGRSQTAGKDDVLTMLAHQNKTIAELSSQIEKIVGQRELAAQF